MRVVNFGQRPQDQGVHLSLERRTENGHDPMLANELKHIQLSYIRVGMIDTLDCCSGVASKMPDFCDG